MRQLDEELKKIENISDRKTGFDNNKYLALQSKNILNRINQFGGKLYMEFGGKLFDDFHASRVLPGFQPDSKVRMLLQLKEQAEIVIVISANSIEQSKRRGDLNITYDQEVLRLIDIFGNIGLYVGSVVITQYTKQPSVVAFEKLLKKSGMKVYRHYSIPDYPNNIQKIVSNEGLGKNDYIETSKSLIVVTAPGPGSGKMATCLSQLYHEHERGINAGYAKYETFPIWNLPLKHPVNLAYEAATADLNDVNMVDPFHLEAYDKTTVNYNRDVEIFPVLRAIFDRIYGKCPYKSPTDMGVNMAGYCVVDDELCCEASKQEIIRRYYSAAMKNKQGENDNEEIYKIELIMSQLGLETDRRRVVAPALARAKSTGLPAVAIEVPDGTIITGKTTMLLGASSAALLNALKYMGGVNHKEKIISPAAIEPIQTLKTSYMGGHNPRLHTDEVLIALSMSAATNADAKKTMQQLPNMKGCEVHSSVMLSEKDINVFKRLGMNLTCEPVYEKKKFYHK